ncbi:MAG: tetratricopeptide repeat protein [Lewinellaceae bacterium]|nr:tetratricopeptide repeat protein [Lewinellaceae bacterium]
MRKLILFCSLLTLCIPIFGQHSTVDSLEQLLEQTKADTTRLRLLDEIANLIYQSDFPKTITYSTEALSLAQKLGDAKHEMRAHYFLGVGHLLSSEEAQAVYHVEKALEIAENKLLDQNGMMDCHNLLGNIYKKMNDVDKALFHLFESAKIAETYDNQDRLATTYSNIGQVYMENGEIQKAKSYYSKALAIFLAEKDLFYAAFLYNNLSEITESPDSSIVLLNKALEIFEKEQYLDGLGHVSNNLGTEYRKLGDYQKALPNLERARQIFEDESHYYKPGLVSVYMNLGIVYGAFGDRAAAVSWFEKSISLAKEIDHKTFLKDAYEQYAHLLETNNNPQEALVYFKLAAEVKDSLFNESKAKELAESETRYQTELKEKELTQKELELEKQSRQKYRILLGGIIVVLLLISVFLFLRYRLQLRRQQAELNLQLEKAQAEKLRDMDRIKSNFFTNISHEFRTPLTLILGPLRQMREGSFKGNTTKYMDIMIRNGERLMNLVNQLLDLSKLEGGKMSLNLEQGDLVKTLKAMVYAFESLAERQEINLEVNIPDARITAWFDKDKLEKVMINLLSNAFKFTPERGTVCLEFELRDNGQKEGENIAVIRVKDTGMGIPQDQLPMIFERFFQTTNVSEMQAGSGIGLALSKELVELHNGTILVESEVDKGTVFIIELPVGKAVLESGSAQPGKNILVQTGEYHPGDETVETGGKTRKDQPMVLLVEDNADVRMYVKEQLEGQYNVVEAEDGEAGVEKAIQLIPDLIISDVMMPKMNGMELCKTLKANDKTSHIPIIMLTAKAEQEDKIEGLQLGADDYLMKPFDARELNVRIQNLIEQRRRLQKSFGTEFTFHPESVEVSSVDETFLLKVKSTIEENLDDETFSVEDLSQSVGMSRSQLHRKLKAMTNQSPNEIIRVMRLLRAKELLEKKAGNASEIAFMVGFNSLAYFSKCYRDHFGVPPSEDR